MNRLILSVAVFCVPLVIPTSVWAQNTSGVHSPVVKEGERSIQYRLGVEPDDDEGETKIKHRLHYQQAISGDLRWRVIGQTRTTDSSDFDLDFLRAELLWELSDNTDPFKTGLRFDGRIRDDNRPEEFAVNWTNRVTLPSGWDFRGIIIASKQTGDNADDGVGLSTRARISKKIESGQTFGVDLFSDYGNTGNIAELSEQEHLLAPFASTKITESVTLFGGPQFGLTDASPDFEFRLWLNRGF